MKRFILMLMTIVLSMGICFPTFAIESDCNVIIINNVEVIFDSGSSLSNEEKQNIAEYLTNGNSDVQPYGLICNIFGHKNTTEYVITITHCVNSSIPRCLEECWEVITCSRCGNTETVRLDYNYIDCCPED